MTLAIITFLTIAICSFIFVVGSFFFEHDMDHDIGHDADHPDGGVSIFSPKVMGLFGLAFGSGGAVAGLYGLTITACTGIGLASGFGLGLIAYLSLTLLHKQQANSLISDSDLLGATGTVTSRIPPNGVGEVTVLSRGFATISLATSPNEIKFGVPIKIVAITGSSVVVAPVS